jgi:hypothetical protein
MSSCSVNSFGVVGPLIFDSTTAYYLLQGRSKANRIFYLSVPQEALLDVASCLASSAQTQKGWNRIITEKPFGFDALSSQRLTQYLLSKFEENQLYRYLYLPLSSSPICSIAHAHKDTNGCVAGRFGSVFERKI